MKLSIVSGDPFGEKVLGNLVNLPDFCTSCALACNNCRTSLASYVSDIRSFHSIQNNPEVFIDDPEEYIPTTLSKCDILLAIGLHPDILSAIPKMVELTSAKAVVVPIEDRRWCPPSLRRELESELNRLGVENAFPKPFCSLSEQNRPIIDEFIRRYHIGKPSFKIEVDEDRIKDVKVLRSAPCGNSWYVAQQLRFQSLDSNLFDVISKAHHGYPCTASMDVDPELGDTILHKAGYLVREGVMKALGRCGVRATILERIR